MSAGPQPTHDDDPLADVFRHHWGRLVAALLRVFGPSKLDLVEDVVQDAMLRATRAWAFDGVPEDPKAWLLRVAKNLALDALRHQRMAATKHDEIAAGLRAGEREVASRDDPAKQQSPDPFSGARDDDGLTLVFLCCHEALSPTARVSLTLKSVCGFGVGEIAAALLEKEATVAQRLTRAKATLQREDARFVLPPPGPQFETRLRSVLDVLYLLFNEGYRAHHGGDELVRDDLVCDAIRLTDMLARHDVTNRPEVHALLALQLFCGARIPARVRRDTSSDGESLGEVLTLAQQDRSLWRHDWIQAGFHHFQTSIGGETVTPWHVEAAIASVHAATPSYEATPWSVILARYDELLALRPSDPVVRLNRAVALAKVHGPASALGELDAVEGNPRLARYALLHATRAHLLWELGRTEAAVSALERAEELAATRPERALIRRRIEACRRGDPVPAW